MGQELSFTQQWVKHGQSKMDLRIKKIIADAACQIIPLVFLFVVKTEEQTTRMCATQVIQVLVNHLKVMQAHLLMKSANFNVIEFK